MFIFLYSILYSIYSTLYLTTSIFFIFLKQANQSLNSLTAPLKGDALAPLRGPPKALGKSLPPPVGVGPLKPLNGSLGGSLTDTKGTRSLPSKSLGSLKPVGHNYFLELLTSLLSYEKWRQCVFVLYIIRSLCIRMFQVGK